MFMDEQTNKKSGGAKKFFTSKIFKWLLILILEIVSGTILITMIMSLDGDVRNIANNPKPFLIYYAICIVLSVGALSSISKSHKRAEAQKHKGTIRIMSTDHYNYEKQDQAAGHLAVIFVACILVAPFAAPLTLGSGIHSFICKIFGN